MSMTAMTIVVKNFFATFIWHLTTISLLLLVDQSATTFESSNAWQTVVTNNAIQIAYVARCTTAQISYNCLPANQLTSERANERPTRRQYERQQYAKTVSGQQIIKTQIKKRGKIKAPRHWHWHWEYATRSRAQALAVSAIRLSIGQLSLPASYIFEFCLAFFKSNW